MSVVRILIVDDLDIWKNFIVSRLRERSDLHVVGFASDGLQAIQKAEELQPDLILLDLMLPALNGIEAARQIRKVAQASKILFVSGESDLATVRAAFQVGGLGYLWKMEAAVWLLPGMESVLRGERFVSPGLQNCADMIE